jgi:hypothetical protein
MSTTSRRSNGPRSSSRRIEVFAHPDLFDELDHVGSHPVVGS